VEQFLTQKGKACSSIHEPFVRFNFIHGSFDWPLTLPESQYRLHGIIIPLNPSNKTAEFFDATFTCLLHPSVESLWPSQTQHFKKRLEQTIEVFYLIRAFQKVLQIVLFFWGSAPLPAYGRSGWWHLWGSRI
jgi:hypothetical protein